MKKLSKIVFISIILICIFVIIINLIMISKTSKYIDKTDNYDTYDYILVLGAKVVNNEPSLMLKDRLDKAIEIYNSNPNINIIISGDSSNYKVYDEVGVMYNYLINNKVDKSHIIRDNYGINTINSINNVRNTIYNKKIIIVTHKYHLYRSIYIANKLNIDNVGVSAYDYKYKGQWYREIREVLARVKDYILVRLIG